MTVSAAQTDAFYREALEHGTVWAVRDEGGFPAPATPEGRAMPFWSLQSRAQTIVESVPAYHGFEAVPIPLTDWRSRWLPGLERDGVQVGLNWSGLAATGYDLPPADVERNLSAREVSG
ncbi:DUF2750 domain-containing protein [uncultured Nocardioides sp.]|uniref:DUF2750 domain-containing protein n=1 Tax=uncultured Nocardioides sp. TaxID=198441 RepID=UPI00343889D3